MNYCIYEDAVPNNNSLILPNGISGTHNKDLNPKFISPDSGNFRLQQNSPALDSGTPDTTGLYLPGTDIDKYSRINEIIDLGPYENPFINCPDEINMQAKYSPINGYYGAKQKIQIDENVILNSTSATEFSAPSVNINPGIMVMAGGTLEINQVGCIP